MKALRALPGGQEFDLKIEFTPTSPIPYQDALILGDSASYVKLNLHGKGFTPDIRVRDSSMHFYLNQTLAEQCTMYH